MLGAEVIHVESTARPDGTRLLAGLPFTEARLVGAVGDLLRAQHQQEERHARPPQPTRASSCSAQLVATCDVVVENYTPRVLEQLGLDFDAVRAIRPDVVMVRMPGFGLDGPWRDNPAFAFVIEDASGLTWLTGHPDQNPVSPYASATRTPASTP